MTTPFAILGPDADDDAIDDFVAMLRGDVPGGPKPMEKRVVVDALGNLHDDHTGEFVSKDGGGDSGGDSEGKSSFDRETYTSKSIPDRKTEFQKLSQAERDKAADAVNSIPARQAELLKGLPPRPDTGSAEDRVFNRVAQMAVLGTVNDHAAALIQDQGNRVAYALKEIGVELELASRLSLDVVDAMAAQEVETLGRTLGDHGARHLEGDTRMALETLAAIQGEATPEQQAFMAITGAFHDAGYMTGPSQVFLDEDHPHWSQQYFDATVRSDVAAALGDDAAARMSEIIGTHADTVLDWENDPEGSAFRLSDNLALFHEEKLPAMFEYVKGNTAELVEFARGEKSLEDAKAAMHENIDGSKLSDSMKERLNAAVEETSGILPKLTMGMVGAKVGEIGWDDDHVTVDLIRTTANEDLLKALDMGQRQFDKFAKTYGVDPAEFSATGSAIFEQNGTVVLAAQITKVESRMVEMLVRRGMTPMDALAYTRRLRLNEREVLARKAEGGEGPYDTREGSWVKEADGKFAGSGDGGTSGDAPSGKADKATVDEAVAALVKHEQPEIRARDVGAVFDACAKRTDNPDVTELRVKGTLLFGGEGLGIARADMPQIPKERRDEFLDLLKSKGIAVDKEDVDPRDLKPIQKEVSASRAGVMLQTMRDEGGPSGRRIISKDDYVVDGHHHWAAAVALSFERDDVKFPVLRIDAKHDKVMEIAAQWNEDVGITGKSMDEPVAEK